MTETEANAIVILDSLRRAKTQLARLLATKTAGTSRPAALDWLIERGLVRVRTGNRAPYSRFTNGEACAYTTPAGKIWLSSSAGMGVAVVELMRFARARQEASREVSL